MAKVSVTPAPPQRLRLALRWIVFEDQFGNFVLIEPHRTKALGMDRRMKRPPMICVAATDEEYETALEVMLFEYERVTAVSSRHINLVDKVQDARERAVRRDGRADRLPKVA